MKKGIQIKGSSGDPQRYSFQNNYILKIKYPFKKNIVDLIKKI